jgi:O-glycosyl hydrolase
MDLYFQWFDRNRATAGWCCLGLTIALFFIPCDALPAATVTVDGSQRYQQIDGFGVSANHRSWHNSELRPVLDALIDQAGMTLFRVVHDKTDWEATNDNANATVMNWSYYTNVYSSADFEAMWEMIAYLNQKGIASGLALNFQGGGPPWMSATSLFPGMEDEWAEMVASLLMYARNTRHLQFSYVAPHNEPDHDDTSLQGIYMTQDQYLATLRDLAWKLEINGLGDLRFLGPDLAHTSLDWMSAMTNDPIIMSRLDHFSLHSYQAAGGGSSGVGDWLAQSPFADRGFWMTEFNVWCSSCESCLGGMNSWEYGRGTAEYLLAHLANGASAGLVWEGYDSFYHIHECWSYWGLFAVDNINAPVKTYSPRKGFYTVSQISKFVRPGAQRIALTTAGSALNLLAFYHPVSGQLTLVGVNTDASPTTLSGSLASLPAFPNFDLYYTSSTTNLCHAASIPVVGAAFSATVPADCVFTLTANSGVSIAITNPSDGASFWAPAAIALQASASTVTGSLGAVEFFADGFRLGQASAPPYSLTWSNVPPGVYAVTARASNSVGNIAVSSAVRLSVTAVPDTIRVAPATASLPPGGTLQLTATALDAAGSNLNPQPPVVWFVTGGGSIDSNGLFNAFNLPGGPHTVTALSGPVIGLATLGIAPGAGPVLPPQTNRTILELTTLTVTNTAIANPFMSQGATNSLAFSYSNRDALLADNWSFTATTAAGAPRNTEITNSADGSVISYDPTANPGVLRIPCDTGDLWGSANNTRNSLFRHLPTNWLRLRLALSLAPSVDFQQAQMGLYQDDDNYLELGVIYSSYLGGKAITMSVEQGGVLDILNAIPNSATNLFCELDREPIDGSIAGSFSSNGIDWNPIGKNGQPFANPRLVIWTGGSPAPNTNYLPNCHLSRLEITTLTVAPTLLTYSLLEAPAGVNIDTNGVITWQPAAVLAPTTNLIRTVVTDNGVTPLSATNMFAVVVLPPPILSASAGTNGILLSWPAVPANFILEFRSDLSPDSLWAPVTNRAEVVGTQMTVTISPLEAQAFFRLREY